jgi:hypothetical protein
MIRDDDDDQPDHDDKEGTLDEIERLIWEREQEEARTVRMPGPSEEPDGRD